MFSLLENSHFLISQEVLELDRAVTVRVSVHTGSAPPVPLKVIDPELGWEQQSGCCTAPMANESVRSGRACAGGLWRWTGWSSSHPNSPQQMTLCCSSVVEPITPAPHSQWAPVSYPAAGRGSVTVGPWSSCANSLPAKTAPPSLFLSPRAIPAGIHFPAITMPL